MFFHKGFFFWNNCSLNFRKYPKSSAYWSSPLMHLYSYILKATTNLISALQIFSRKCSKSKGFSKFQKFQNKSLENWLFLFNLTGLLFRIFNKSRAQEKCFLWVPWDNWTVPRKRSIMKSFSSKLEISV